METEFSELVRVTEVFKERALEKHRRNLEASQKLADELTQIDTLRQAAQADTESLGARRMMGADALWQGWLVRKRAEILRQSAMARAHEMDSLAQARTAFSRAEAATTLEEEARETAKRKMLTRQADALDALTVMRHSLAEAEGDP